jgi:hypothetical protein
MLNETGFDRLRDRQGICVRVLSAMVAAAMAAGTS